MSMTITNKKEMKFVQKQDGYNILPHPENVQSEGCASSNKCRRACKLCSRSNISISTGNS